MNPIAEAIGAGRIRIPSVPTPSLVLQPGAVSFLIGNIAIEEDGGVYQLPVRRSGGSDGQISVDYASSDITALAGTNYNTASGTLTWLAGEDDDQFIPLTPIDDEIVQGTNLVFSVNLSNVIGGAVLGGIDQIQVTINNDDTAGVVATAWVGIPDPTSTLGFTPWTVPEPADPAPWPAAESVGSGYMDALHPNATDSGNAWGYPDQPRLTPPSGTITYKMVIAGGQTYGGGTVNIVTSGGTPANPVFVTGRGRNLNGPQPDPGANRPQLDDRILAITGGTHTVTQYIDIINFSDTSNVCFTHSSDEFQVLRWCEFSSNGFNLGYGTACGTTTNCVYYGIEVHDFGDIDVAAPENDLHAFLPVNRHHVWILNCVTYRMAGDGVQVGQANTVAADTHHIYIGGMVSYNNKENAIDVKRASDVIISGGDYYDFPQVSHSNGEGIIIHNTALRVWCINNKIRDCYIGIITSGCIDCYFIGNLIYDLRGTAGSNTGYGVNACMHSRGGGGEMVIAFNTCHNYGYGVQLTTGNNTTHIIHGNLFAARTGVGTDIRVATTGIAANTTSTDNFYDNKTVQLNGSSESGSVSGDPLFTDAAAKDFTLQPASPAIDVVDDNLAAFDTFQANYGLDIKTDILGIARVNGSMDAGCYERAA